MRETFWRSIDQIVGPATMGDFEAVGQKSTRDAFEQFILEKSTPETRLLDAGCSTGVEGFRLYRKGFPGAYVGLDSNPKALHLALSNLHGTPATFALSDLESTGFASGSFDIVLSKDVIEHAPSYRAILRELARLAGDWLILSMFIRMDEGPGQIREDQPGLYLNRYCRKDLVDFVRALGFDEPSVLFQEGEDEVLAFRKQSAPETGE